MNRKKKDSNGSIKLIERNTLDENFAHTMTLLGPCAAWAESIHVGHRINFNERNMVQIPVEIALAFATLHARDNGALGDACRKTLEYLKMARTAFAEQSELLK